MKLTLLIILTLTLGFSAFGQTVLKPDEFIELAVTDNNMTSELLPLPVVADSDLVTAKFGAMYFGPRSESDISVILILKGTKSRYSSDNTFSVKFLIDGDPLNWQKNRGVASVKKQEDEEVLRFHVKIEELAKLAAAKTLSLDIYNADTEKKYDTLTFTPKSLTHLKKFGDSVVLIKSRMQ